MKLYASWLAADQGPPAEVAGVVVPTWSSVENAPFPTRRSEYRWLAQQFEGADHGPILDAGAGFNPEIHLAPQILANLGFDVMAVDAEPESLKMPPTEGVLRYCGDICALPFPDKSYRYWVSVSVLEHMTNRGKAAALAEAFRLLQHNGYLLLTTDDMEPSLVNAWLCDAGFETGPALAFTGEHLSPRVACAVARKP